MLESFTRKIYVRIFLTLMFIPLMIAYMMSTVYMGMEGIYNVMMLCILTVLWAFAMYLFGMITTIVVGKWFNAKGNFKIVIPASGTPIIVESQSHNPSPSSLISMIKYKVCDCDPMDYDLTTGIVFHAFNPPEDEYLILSGIDVKISIDNKIFLNGNLQFYEQSHEWRVKLQLDYDDEQKAYMMLMIKTLQLFDESKQKIITANVGIMETAMKKTLSIINNAYDLILPTREKANIPLGLSGGNTEIERIKAEGSKRASKSKLTKDDLNELDSKVNSLQKTIAES